MAGQHSRRQKGHGKQRPRAFHRGRAQGGINDKTMRNVVEPAFAAAEQNVVEVAALAASSRRDLREWELLVSSCARVPSQVACASFPSVLG